MKKILIALALSAMTTSAAFASGLKTYTVSITNATNYQVVTPPLLVTHRSGFKLFEVGAEASQGLAILAETGDNQTLLSEVENARRVFKVVAGSEVIPPGQTLDFEIRAPRHGLLSLAAMLATTNDAFAALSGVRLPAKSASYLAYVYDAGSEKNNELCSHIPGPPCGAPPNDRTEGEGEGFVAIHRGIHGIGDLDAAMLDWRGPALVVSIKRGRIHK